MIEEIGDFRDILGAGVSLGNLRFGVRYSLGLADINDIDEDNLKHAVVIFGAEFVF